MNRSLLSSVLALSFVTACSGSATLPSTSQAPGSGTTTVAFVVVVPSAPSGLGRWHRYVAPSTQSMVASLNGKPLLTADLAPSSHACTWNGKSRRCMARTSAPSGDQTFDIATYDGPHGTGNLLAQGQVQADLVPNRAQQLNISLFGKPAQVSLSLSSPYPPAGRPAHSALTVSVLDADGNTIVGDYESAVTLKDADGSGATRLSATNLSGSSTNVTLDYDGKTLSSATITADAGGVLGKTTFAPSPTTIEQYPAPQLSTPNGPRPMGVSDLCIGPDGNVWATGASSGAIEKITPQGTYTTYPLLWTEPIGISAGSDGNMWFAEMQAGKIGRITTSGVITSFTIPTASGAQSQPSATTAGPDGRTWFVVEGINEPSVAGAIAPSTGKMSIYALPPGALPVEIVGSPDGNLWISDGGLNALVEISTAGKVLAVRTLPTPNAGPWGIGVGPDKNIWFAEFGANHIGRMTSSGAITEYSPPTAFSGPLNVAAGPDGNEWFTEMGGGFWDFDGKIGYITTDGSTIRDFPGGSLTEHVHDLAFDTKGHLWYTKFAFAESALDELAY